MEDKQRRRELVDEYKERPVTGGVYLIKNTEESRVLLLAGLDLNGLRNRFNFSVATNTCIHSVLQADWKRLGAKAFAFEVLEEIKKKDDETLKAFREDLDVLLELWREKLGGQDFY